MSKALRREWSTLAGVGALAALTFTRKKHLATGLGLLAAGLRVLPELNPYTFRNKVALITGGSRGFGLALAETLLQQGAQVGIIARDLAELERAEQLLQSRTGRSVAIFVADVTRPKELEHTFAAAHAHFGRLDVLVNNAGAVAAGPFLAMEPEDFAAQIKLHLQAPVLATRLILPYFAEQGGGRILNISSLGGKMPLPHMSTYAASKFALAGFSSSVSAELAAKNVRVTTAYPGLMRTGSPIQGVFRGDEEKEFAWFLAGDIAPGLSMPADRAARLALSALREGRREIILSLAAKAGTLLYQLLPETFLAAASLAQRTLPAKEKGARFTGAESQGLLQKHLVGRALLARNASYAQRWNQEEKSDADFNLNVRE